MYLCILNPVLMLEHALTEYYVSICFVNLLYSNCSLPLRVNDEIKSVHIHLLKIKLDTFKVLCRGKFLLKNIKYFPDFVILLHIAFWHTF